MILLSSVTTFDDVLMLAHRRERYGCDARGDSRSEADSSTEPRWTASDRISPLLARATEVGRSTTEAVAKQERSRTEEGRFSRFEALRSLNLVMTAGLSFYYSITPTP